MRIEALDRYSPTNTETIYSSTGEKPQALLREGTSPLPALIVVWANHFPERIGVVFLIPKDGGEEPWLFGCRSAQGKRRLAPLRQYPGVNRFSQPLMERKVSRQQLLFRNQGNCLSVQNIGRRNLYIDGEFAPVGSEYPLKSGQILNIGEQLLLLVSERPYMMPGMLKAEPQALGQVDDLGIVGESPVAWAMRQRLSAWAQLDNTHVLIQGPSGTGKEMVARGLHQLSPRGQRPLVSRSAASIPESLIDAELFGNSKGFPNPGMKDHPGLLGEAKGSSLFLDEIGEISHALQARLLRVMDGGEYTRLGETRARRADLRLIAATNRPMHHLKHDFLARFALRFETPGLKKRQEDIPLIARHLLKEMTHHRPEIGKLQLSLPLTQALLNHTYTTHVREIKHILYQSLEESPTQSLLPPSFLNTPLLAPEQEPLAPPTKAKTNLFTEEEQRRLKMMGSLGFSAKACGDSPDYPTNRQNATLTLTLCAARVLGACDWHFPSTLAHLEKAGGLTSEDVNAKRRLKRTVMTFLKNQKRTAETHTNLNKRERLKNLRRYGQGATAVLTLQTALIDGRLIGWPE